jgi:hypothetical protein
MPKLVIMPSRVLSVKVEGRTLDLVYKYGEYISSREWDVPK